jgi:hypothetical protein
LSFGLQPSFARIALLAGTIALAVTASTASAGTLKTGFLDPSNAALSDPAQELSPAAAMDGVEFAGSKIARFYVYWRAVAGDNPPASPANPNDPSYDWNAQSLEDNVNAAHNRGFDILLTLRSAPDWAQRGTPDGRGTRDPSPKKLKQFTRAALAKFPNVKYWGVWNEPNYRTFLSPQYRHGKLVSPGMYRTLLNTAAEPIHKQGKFVVAGETAPFSHWDPKGRPTAAGPMLFVRKLLCMDAHNKPTCKTNVHADIWATHPYTSGNVWHHALDKNSVSYGDLPGWTKMIRAAAKAKHITNKNGNHSARFWISEFSWDSKPIDPIAVPNKLHVRWTAESLYRAWKLGIEAVLWGQLRDYPISSAKFYGQYQSGLFYCDDTPTIDDACPVRMDPAVTGPNETAKDSLQAFRFPFVAYAGGGKIKIWGRTPLSNQVQVTIQREVSPGVWNQWKPPFTAGAGGIFKKTYSSSLKTGKFRAVVSAEESPGFGLVRPPDKSVRPFGCGGVVDCP